MIEDNNIVVHAEATSAALRKLASQLGDVGRRTANQQLASQMSSWITRNFDAEGALNQVWAQLQESTAKKKIKKDGTRRGYEHILVVSGLLRGSFVNFQYDADSATVGTPIKYAPFHEEGVPQNNLPKRPMLPSQAIAIQMAMDVYNRFIANSAKDVGLA